MASVSPKIDEVLDTEPEPTTVVGMGLGPGIIGQKQFAFNQRHGAKSKSALGPAMSMTPDEYVAWMKDEKPANWQQWQDTYRAAAAERTAHEAQHQRGRRGGADHVIRTL